MIKTQQPSFSTPLQRPNTTVEQSQSKRDPYVPKQDKSSVKKEKYTDFMLEIRNDFKKTKLYCETSNGILRNNYFQYAMQLGIMADPTFRYSHLEGGLKIPSEGKDLSKTEGKRIDL